MTGRPFPLPRPARRLAAALIALTALAWAVPVGDRAAVAQEPIRVGELNSYNRFPAFTVPYRKGWTLGMERINEAGGILGRPLEIMSRDDGGTPADAVRVAEELVGAEGAQILFGSLLSNIGVALADYAKRNKILYLAAEPLTDAITLDQGNRYTFRLRTNTYMQTGMLVEEAAKLGVKRWAIVAPNYEYGQSAAAAFEVLLKQAIPDAEIVERQFPPLGKIDAGATVQALLRARPDGLFNVLFGGDLARFVREGDLRGLFWDRPVLSLLTGDPEWVAPLKDEAPEGWIVTGYPWYEIDTPEHDAFVADYRARWDEDPTLGSLLGYVIPPLFKKAIERAGAVDTDAMIEAMRGLRIDTPVGPVTFRAIDHQATLGAFVGRLTVRDGLGVMRDWRYADGEAYMHPPEMVEARRPKD